MTSKYLFYQVNKLPSNEIFALAKHFYDNGYSEESGDGFLVDEVRRTYLDARYCEREFDKQVQLDPFGHEVTVEQTFYYETKFRLYLGVPNLLLINPPRSTQAFISALSGAFNDLITAEVVELDVRLFIEELSLLDSELKIKQVRWSNIPLSISASAALVISSEGNALQYFSQLGFAKNGIITNACIQIDIDGVTEKIELSKHGRIKLNSSDQDNLIDVIRKIASPRLKSNGS